jgi:DNA gyrase/topoisomerase IV subunit B
LPKQNQLIPHYIRLIKGIYFDNIIKIPIQLNKNDIYTRKTPRQDCGAARYSHITRFKGLREINPKEFGQFIGEDMRLVPVGISVLKAVPQVLTFYMGKNTPERREYIMKNLMSDAG